MIHLNGGRKILTLITKGITTVHMADPAGYFGRGQPSLSFCPIPPFPSTHVIPSLSFPLPISSTVLFSINHICPILPLISVFSSHAVSLKSSYSERAVGSPSGSGRARLPNGFLCTFPFPYHHSFTIVFRSFMPVFPSFLLLLKSSCRVCRVLQARRWVQTAKQSSFT